MNAHDGAAHGCKERAARLFEIDARQKKKKAAPWLRKEKSSSSSH
jgi:hypothetical protein